MSNPSSATSSLAKQKCKACEGGVGKLGDAEVKSLLKEVPAWQLTAAPGGEIGKTFKFANYYETMAFVNAVAWVSHREDHHPDLEVGYNKCTVRYTTHAVGGLSENDFICAAKVEALFAM